MNEQQLVDEGVAILREILAANEDLGQRLATLPVWVLYEPDEDLFSLILDRPQEALTEETDSEIYVRVHPETMKIVAFEIPRLGRRIRDDPTIAHLWKASVRMAGPNNGNSRPAEHLARKLRELIAASTPI
jgi:hypothetical protein